MRLREHTYKLKLELVVKYTKTKEQKFIESVEGKKREIG